METRTPPRRINRWISTALTAALGLGFLVFAVLYRSSAREVDALGTYSERQGTQVTQLQATVQQQTAEIQKQAGEIRRLKDSLRAAQGGNSPATAPAR